MPFTAQTRMSGVDLPDEGEIRKGAVDAISAGPPGTAEAAPA